MLDRQKFTLHRLPLPLQPPSCIDNTSSSSIEAALQEVCRTIPRPHLHLTRCHNLRLTALPEIHACFSYGLVVTDLSFLHILIPSTRRPRSTHTRLLRPVTDNGSYRYLFDELNSLAVSAADILSQQSPCVSSRPGTLSAFFVFFSTFHPCR